MAATKRAGSTATAKTSKKAAKAKTKTAKTGTAKTAKAVKAAVKEKKTKPATTAAAKAARAAKGRASRAAAKAVEEAREMLFLLATNVFDGGEFDVAEQLALIDAAHAELGRRGSTLSREEVFAVAAEHFEDSLDMPAVIALDQKRSATKHAAAAAREGGPAAAADELDALVGYRPAPGKTLGLHGEMFEDDAAKELADAWARLDGRAFARRMFVGMSDLRIRNFGPLRTIEGLELVSDLQWLELCVTPTTSLAPLGALARLRTLRLDGEAPDLASLTRLGKLVQLHVTTAGAGVAQLPAIPRLRSLNLTVDASVDLSPLIQIKQLNGLDLWSPGRTPDAALHAVLHKLWRRGVRIRMSEHEAWPATLDLPIKVTPGYVILDKRAP